MLSKIGQELLDASRPDFSRIESLLAQGADFNEIDPEDGQTVFSSIVEDHHHEIYDFIRMGAKPSVREQTSGHALIYAIWSLNYGLLRGLLQNGADPNQIAFTDPGDDPGTALDTVNDDLHCDQDPHAQAVLNAMGELLKEQGGRYACELKEQ